MRPRSLFRQFFPITVLVVMVAFAATGRFAGQQLKHFFHARTVSDLQARAELVAALVQDHQAGGPIGPLESMIQDLGKRTGTRITVIAQGGKVLAESDKERAVMTSHADRPEIIQALAGRMGAAERFSDTLGESMMYVAVPVRSEGQVVAIARTSQPLQAVDGAIRSMQLTLAAIAGGLAAALLLVLFVLLRKIARSLDDLQQGAQRFAGGDLQHRLALPETKELHGLAGTLNTMAAQLDERMQMVARQRNEREAMLSSMVEGVLAVDRDERILQINRAAVQLTGVRPEAAVGRYLAESVRIVGLQRVAQSVLAGQEVVEAEVTLPAGEDHVLLVHGAALHDADGKAIGALLVMSDISRLRKLERVRRDFVANVSHEIKTPLTSIQGFVETLLEGALEQPENARRFLTIIGTHAERLYAIVEDLLSLARIEEEVGKGQVEMAVSDLREVLTTAVGNCADTAGVKGVKLVLQAPDVVRVRMNAALIGQAVVNLLDNAIKYSEPKTTVTVDLTAASSAEWAIRVRDQGCGIEAQDQERIFERFYRVDKSRSRKVGGTGLGLSIVKHIVSAHGGRITVESRLGSGSTFAIFLKAA